MKKTIIILILFEIILFSLSNKILAQSKIKGTLTYFFNNYQGNKPDTGAEIFVVDSLKAPDFDYKIYYTFNTAITYRHIYNNSAFIFNDTKEIVAKYENKKKFKSYYDKNFELMKSNEKKMNESYAELVKIGAETEEKFNELDEKNYNNILKITLSNEHTINTIADGTGNYTFRLEPGTYYVILQSKGRQGLSISESQGLLHYYKVRLVEDKIIDISKNFKL